MYYPQVQNNGNSRTLIDTWLGYNHNYKIGSGEFFDMENMTSDNYPLLTPRAIRPRLANGTMRGVIITDNKLTYLDGTTLHYGAQSFDLSDLLDDEDTSWQNLYRFGAYLVMHPACIYINLYKPTDKGTMASKYVTDADATITMTVCTADGNDFDKITASDEAPTNAATGDRWLKTLEGEQGLYVYNKDSWEAVPVCYIRFDIEDAELTSAFEEGDVVFMNSPVGDINNGSQIQTMTDENFVVIGLMDAVTKEFSNSESWRFKMERKIPTMNYVCCDKNRMWGCYYGWVDGEMVNEIYASELGDFKNWYTFQGLANDSYSVTVGVPEVWTGCISYQGYPTFFKENAIIRIYGSMPSQYTVNQIDARGVQSGSSNSLAIVDEYLVYKSAVDICVFDGSSPRSISEALGRNIRYYLAVGGACINKYMVEMVSAKGAKKFFVYDFKTGLWEKENSIGAKKFTNTENGQMYVATSTDIYGMGVTENMAYADKLVTEEWVEWYAETGDMGFEYADYKYVNRITVRAYIPSRSELKVSVSYDDSPFMDAGVLRGDTNLMSQSLAFNPFRCDHYRVRFEGHGDCVIYSLAITLDTGSEEDGH